MAVSAKIVSFLIATTDTGSYSVTGAGFTPKAVYFWWTGRSEASDTAGTMTHTRGHGYATGASAEAAIMSQSDHNVDTSDAGNRNDTTSCISVMNNAETIVGVADFTAFTSDGCTLNISDTFPANIRIFALFLGGASITNALVGNFTQPATTGNYDATTTAGFVPTFMMLLANQSTNSVHSDNVVGAATSSSAQICVSTGARWNQATSVSEHYALDSVEVFGLCTNGSVGDRNAFVDFTPSTGTGFRLNKLSGTSACVTNYLLLAGGSYAVGSFLTKTDTTDIVVSGLGFRPAAVLLFSSCATENTQNVVATIDQASVGGFTSTSNVGAMTTRDNDASNFTVVSAAVDYDKCYINLDSAGAVQGLMEVISIDSGGFTLRMADADPTAAWVGYIAFGPGQAIGGPQLQRGFHGLTGIA